MGFEPTWARFTAWRSTWLSYGHNQHTIQGPGWVGPVVMKPGETWIVMYLGPGTYEYPAC